MRRAATGPILVLFLLSVAGLLPANAAERSEVPLDWQTRAQRQIAEAEYELSWQERPLVSSLSPAWQAPNRAQGFRTYFTESGPRVIPRSEDAPSWQWGLHLSGVGRGDTRLALEEMPPLVPQANRITYRRGSVEEWYVNDSRGLKQGFTLSDRPDGDKNPLRLTFLLEGSLSPIISADGQAIDFVTPEGARALRYAELLVTDATGRELPAHMDGWSADGARGIRIVVEDREAVWPLTIDPLLTSPAWTAESDQVAAAFGFTVAAAGDVNGDGYGDVIVGAPQFDNGQTDEGRAFVYHGSASGLSMTPNWTEEIDQASAFFARAVGTAGDVNGDGYSDVIVSAPLYDNGQTDEGRAYVYYGSASGLPASESWSAEGNQASAQFSWSLGTAGDVNGDGYADVIVGSQLFDNGQTDEGRAFVFHGSASGLSLTANWTGESNQAFAGFGESVATAGDVNGDGYADVIVGASLFDNGQIDEGRAFVFHGSASGLSLSANWTAESDQFSAQFGTSSGTAGDVNGDGYADVIVGAYGYSGPEASEGRAYVFHGSSLGLSLTPAWTAEGNQVGAQLGSSVGTAGDVNGDGYADVVVGAVTYDGGETDEGRGYLYFGSPSGLVAVPGWTAEGNQTSAVFAASIATAGDVNGDGYADVIVGAPNFDNGETDEGRAYVYLGSASGLSLTYGSAVAGESSGVRLGFSVGGAGDVNGDGYADWIVGIPGQPTVLVSHGSPSSGFGGMLLEGESDSQFGFAGGTAGDVNGDGYADVIVGAPNFDNGQADEGRTFVFHGSASGLSPTPSWTAESDEPGANFGVAVGTAGDVNGDGYADVIVGAYGYDGPEADEGRAYVFHGSPTGLSPIAAWTAEGNQAAAQFGFSVGTAGDVNGDGYADVVVGAPTYDNGQTDEGRAYVYHGSAVGLSLAPSWTGETDNLGVQFGMAVGTAGDVNGDGFSDVIVGAPRHPGANPNEGRAYVYYGSVSGLSPTVSWFSGGSFQASARFGSAVGTAGDVNGDGYSDVIVGAPNADSPQFGAGRAYVYQGSVAGLSLTADWTAERNLAGAHFGSAVGTAGDVNGDGYADVIVGAYADSSEKGFAAIYLGGGGAGRSLRPQQRRADDAAPIASMGTSGSPDSARLGALGRTPFGRGRVKLEWEVKPLGTPFDGSGLQSSAGWLDTGTAAIALNEVATGLARKSVHHWRVRLRYHPGTTPFQSRGRWFTSAWNGWPEGDFRTQALADVSVSQVDAADPVLPGLNLTYTLSVLNTGPDPSPVFVADPVPAGATFVGATPSQGSCAPPAGGVLQCALGVLPSGGGATVAMTVTPQAAGMLSNTASVPIGGPLADPDPSDNSSVETTSVVAVSIGDRVWDDTDGDGVQDAGESGAANVLVALYDGAGTFLNATTTSASGAYAFPNLSVGATYRLRFLPPTSQVLSSKDQGGDDLLDSDVDPLTQLTPAFALVNGQDPVRWDAGLVPSCVPPDERIFIYTVTQSTDGNHYPILHFQDANQLSQVTGYNVYRSSNRALPPASWPLAASNVIDMDQATPNKQWVDSSGDVSPSGTWYYQVTAVNSRCPAEGPF